MRSASFKPNKDLTPDELHEIERHQSFILNCSEEGILLLLIHQLEHHANTATRAEIEPTFLGGNLLVTPALAEQWVRILRAIRP